MKYVSLFVCFALLIACSGKKAPQNIVTVTIEPQRYFAEKIAGDKFTINCVVPSGQSPETYDPTPQQMLTIGKSVAYLKIGHIGFEQAWMKSITQNNPHLKLFDLSEGIDLIGVEEAVGDEALAHGHAEGEACTHGNANESGHNESGHSHAGVDPHTWSSMAGAKTIAYNTLQAFVALDKENTAYYWANYNALLKEIEQTEARVAPLLKGLAHRTFIIYHPALSYLAREYGLTQLCIELDGKEPSSAQLKALVDGARNHQARVVFIQQEFDQKNAELIARETGCKLVQINPLAYNWHEEMIRIAQSMKDAEIN